MRLEATVPESRAVAVEKLAEELGVSKSQLIDEALALFLIAVREARAGRRLVTTTPGSAHATCEIVTPTLFAMESPSPDPQVVDFGPAAIEKIAALAALPPKANARLRAAAKRHPR
jgi:hypothetical protein